MLIKAMKKMTAERTAAGRCEERSSGKSASVSRFHLGREREKVELTSNSEVALEGLRPEENSSSSSPGEEERKRRRR